MTVFSLDPQPCAQPLALVVSACARGAHRSSATTAVRAADSVVAETLGVVVEPGSMVWKRQEKRMGLLQAAPPLVTVTPIAIGVVMSASIISALRHQTQLRGNTFLIATELAHRMNHSGYGRVSYQFLAWKAHCCRQTAITQIAKLLHLGLIRKT